MELLACSRAGTHDWLSHDWLTHTNHTQHNTTQHDTRHTQHTRSAGRSSHLLMCRTCEEPPPIPPTSAPLDGPATVPRYGTTHTHTHTHTHDTHDATEALTSRLLCGWCAQVAFGSHCKSLFVYDAETMHLHRSYQDAFFGGSDRAPLGALLCSSLCVCVCGVCVCCVCELATECIDSGAPGGPQPAVGRGQRQCHAHRV